MRRGWVASIGHTRAAPDLLDAAFAAGASHMTHFMNAMTGMHHRETGAVTWGLTRDDVTCDVIADAVHVHPLALQIILRCKTPERVVLISDAVSPAGCGDGDFELWGGSVRVEHGRTQSEAGSLSGSVITVLDAVRLMLSLGVPLTHVARMASLNPARLLRLDGECGSITEGKRADLVAVDDDGRVRLTLVGGRVV